MINAYENPIQVSFSNVPALIFAKFADGASLECFYIDAGQVEYYSNNKMRQNVVADVPDSLRKMVEEQFDKVFSLPLEQRQQYITENKNFVFKAPSPKSTMPGL